MNEDSIYLDYAATTPVDPAVIDAMSACLGVDGDFANPSSSHARGRRARRLVEDARAEIAERVGAAPAEIVFTSGATESNNLALKGALLSETMRPKAPARSRLVTTRIEHKSILDSARVLRACGIDTELLDCDANGVVSPERIEEALTGETALVSVMHVNNEIGTAQDVESIARMCGERGILFHFDAAQSVGKLPIRLDEWGVDLCSLTAHKICGPKGIGALFVRRGLALSAFMHGGEQERGLRAGTLATHQIVGMGKAYALADPEIEPARIAALSALLEDGLASIEGARRNGSRLTSIPHIVNFRFPGVEGESLRYALSDLAVSAGSACNSDVAEPSYVLSSLGLSDAGASSSLRFSLGRFTTRTEIETAVERVRAEVTRLRALAPSAPTWCSA